METRVICLQAPRALRMETLGLSPPGADELVIDIHWSGISTGTEKLFWNGEMPPFPGMGYPLVPGYEAAGEVVEAGAATGMRPGQHVFVPGANCFEPGVHGLFGGAASRLVSAASRVAAVDSSLGSESALLALAATARHALTATGPEAQAPELIVGHGVVGRLLARMTLLGGNKPPVVWERDPQRRGGAHGYEVIDPDSDDRRDYRVIYDASGNAAILNDLVGRLVKGGEIVLAGFYPDNIAFAFAPAFIKEARLRIAAEWTPEDLTVTAGLVNSGALSLGGLISHCLPASAADEAYPAAFADPAVLKMVLNWKDDA
ncbi:MAG: chlorophyll synthesis pathway protein BchC [Pseudomonadota bacterium]